MSSNSDIPPAGERSYWSWRAYLSFGAIAFMAVFSLGTVILESGFFGQPRWNYDDEAETYRVRLSADTTSPVLPLSAGNCLLWRSTVDRESVRVEYRHPERKVWITPSNIDLAGDKGMSVFDRKYRFKTSRDVEITVLGNYKYHSRWCWYVKINVFPFGQLQPIPARPPRPPEVPARHKYELHFAPISSVIAYLWEEVEFRSGSCWFFAKYKPPAQKFITEYYTPQRTWRRFPPGASVKTKAIRFRSATDKPEPVHIWWWRC